MDRIDKVISNLKCLSRSDARRLIKIGKVFVNGEKVKSFDKKVSDDDRIEVNNELLSNKKSVYIIMNKPQGIVCDDKSNSPYAPTVLDDSLRRKDLFCVGRLDKDTTGLLIITNDGEFAHKVISPKSDILKRYKVKLDEKITDEKIEELENGITLLDETKLLPAKVEIVNEERTEIIIGIREGKYHQIKRMIGAVSNRVTSLERISIGNLQLNGLEIGQAIAIDENEANKVFTR